MTTRQKLSISMAGDLLRWARQRAKAHGLTLSGFIAMILSAERSRG